MQRAIILADSTYKQLEIAGIGARLSATEMAEKILRASLGLPELPPARQAIWPPKLERRSQQKGTTK